MTPYYAAPGVAVYHALCCDVFDAVDLFPTSTIITGPPFIRAVYHGDGSEMPAAAWTPKDEADGYATCIGFHGQWMQRAQTLLERSSGRCWIVTSASWLPSICRTGVLLHWPIQEMWYSMPLDQALLLFGLGIPRAERLMIDAVFHACVTTPKIPLRLLDALLSVNSDGPVLDPFCGHGSVLVAAKRAGLQAVGVDIKREKCDATIAALEAA